MRRTAELQELMGKKTQEAVDRINGVYTSAINTLKQLELTDASIFDFFQKTGGNIRVYEGLNKMEGTLSVELGYTGDLSGGNNRLRLKEKTKYKIIVMAIEIKDEGGQK